MTTKAIAGAAPPPSLSERQRPALRQMASRDCGGGAPAFIERRPPLEWFLAGVASDCGGGAPAFIER